MPEVTQILSQIEQGDSSATDELLPLVYNELRKLAAARLAEEQPGQTLQATALVHEAYMRLIGDADQKWNGRGHFFAAAAEAMRRILVESARSKSRLKRGVNWQRLELSEIEFEHEVARRPQEVLIVDAALDTFAAIEPLAAELVKLRYFAEFSNSEAAEILGISPRKATQLWTYARAWLLAEMESS